MRIEAGVLIDLLRSANGIIVRVIQRAKRYRKERRGR
jgi:hypothetical protein